MRHKPECNTPLQRSHFFVLPLPTGSAGVTFDVLSSSCGVTSTASSPSTTTARCLMAKFA